MCLRKWLFSTSELDIWYVDNLLGYKWWLLHSRDSISCSEPLLIYSKWILLQLEKESGIVRKLWLPSPAWISYLRLPDAYSLKDWADCGTTRRNHTNLLCQRPRSWQTQRQNQSEQVMLREGGKRFCHKTFSLGKAMVDSEGWAHRYNKIFSSCQLEKFSVGEWRTARNFHLHDWG